MKFNWKVMVALVILVGATVWSVTSLLTRTCPMRRRGR